MNLIKLSVGSESIETLAQWQEQRRQELGIAHSLHVTRMWPKREKEILNGGSMYWVIKGFIQVRQTIIGFDEIIGSDGIRRCGIKLSPDLFRTTAAQRRPFQGWRYLQVDDAPSDLPHDRVQDDDLPKDMELALADLGLK